MKKFLVIIILATINFGVFCIDFNKDEFYVRIDDGQGIYASKTELIQIDEGISKAKIIARAPRPKSLVNSFGYLELKVGSIKVYVIDLNGLLIIPQKFEIDLANLNSHGINKDITITASSVLTEKTKTGIIEYNPSFMLNRLTREKEIGEYLYWHSLPWSSDSKDNKEPVISIHSKNPIKSFSILNGYLDFTKQNLLLDNARARKIEVIDIDSNMSIGTFILSDTLHYNKVILDKASQSFKIKIVDIFPGKKYNDICISSLVFDEFYNNKPGDYGISFIQELKQELSF